MAKKKKDDIENEDDINQDSQGDFNEADDNFGLPDVDYQPIDREEESEEDSSSYESTSSYESSDDSSDESETDYSNEESDIFASEDTSKEQEYVPGSYTPPKDDSMAPKIIGLILVLLLAGAGIWYFGFYRPEQQRKEQARIEKQQEEDARQKREAEAAAERKRQEELAAQRAAEAKAAEEAKPKEGTIETISSTTGRYYVVISSAIDGDLAMDYAKKRQKEGVSTFILAPRGTSKFHRIAVSSFDTWADAQAKADDLKGQFGDGVWVIKY